MFSAKERKRTKALIKEFMAQRDFPGWFIGLSDVQIDAANTLMNNIRDDIEQGTCHRVRDNLIKLGLYPVVNCAKIKLAMRLSRGNDMAFIYFLMDLFYRRTCDDCKHSTALGYTANERVCMSVIAHLDTIPTLREMDRLLPIQPPQPPKKKKPRKKRRPKKTYLLPYFEKQFKPANYGKSLCAIEPVNIPSLGFYDNYRNSNYVVPNMKTRWFADYKLKEGQRIAKGVIDDQLETIMEHEKAGTLTETAKRPTLCTLHTNAVILKENLANELKVIRKQECEKYFDMEGHLKDKSYKRVVESLDMEIIKAQEHFNASVDKSTKCPKHSRGSKSRRKSEERPSKSNSSKQNLINSEKLDYGHAIAHEQKNDFFEGPSCNKPYKFNYEKIFDLGARNPVSDSIVKALRTCSEGEMLTDHTAAVRECCKDIWAAEVKRYNKMFEDKRRELEKEMQAEKEDKNLGFNLPYYDPKNRKLMEALIFRALREIKKDKKFVLAGMPNAYKVPVLREFTKIRYGMVYTKKAKRKEFSKLTKKIFHLLQKDDIRVPIPQIVDVSEERYVTYNCRDYVFNKTNHLTDQYHHNFAVTLLEAVRICWGAVRPFQCTKGPPREVFFAYLPAREKDIDMFRPWNVNEYIHAKEEWDRRQRIKQMALQY